MNAGFWLFVLGLGTFAVGGLSAPAASKATVPSGKDARNSTLKGGQTAAVGQGLPSSEAAETENDLGVQFMHSLEDAINEEAPDVNAVFEAELSGGKVQPEQDELSEQFMDNLEGAVNQDAPDVDAVLKAVPSSGEAQKGDDQLSEQFVDSLGGAINQDAPDVDAVFDAVDVNTVPNAGKLQQKGGDKLSQQFFEELAKALEADLASTDGAQDGELMEFEQPADTFSSFPSVSSLPPSTVLSDDDTMKGAGQLEAELDSLPTGLKRLLWGEETVPQGSLSTAEMNGDIIGDGTQPQKATNGAMDSETACVVKCAGAHSQLPPEDIGCEQMQEAADCLAKCKPGPFAEYAYEAAKRLNSAHCVYSLHPDHATTFNWGNYMQGLAKRGEECSMKMISDRALVLKAAQYIIGCMLELEQAATDEDACHSLKSCLVDGMTQRMGEWCSDSEVADTLKRKAIYGLSMLSTNGNLIHTCPTLYETANFPQKGE